MAIVGTTPEHLVISWAASPQPCKADTPSRISAPDDAIASTSGRRFSRAMMAALRNTPEAADDKAPLCTVSCASAQTTRRPPASSRTAALAAPGTLRER